MPLPSIHILHVFPAQFLIHVPDEKCCKRMNAYVFDSILNEIPKTIVILFHFRLFSDDERNSTHIVTLQRNCVDSDGEIL